MRQQVFLKDIKYAGPLRLYKGDFGLSERHTPCKLPVMELKTIEAAEAVKLCFSPRAVFASDSSVNTDVADARSTSLFGERPSDILFYSCAYHLIERNKDVAAFFLPSSSAIYDIYCKNIHGNLDPGWYLNMDESRMFNFFTYVNYCFSKFTREWYWSSGDALCVIEPLANSMPKPLSSIKYPSLILYLGCSGNVRLNYFCRFKNSTRYYMETLTIPYSVWSYKNDFIEQLDTYKDLKSSKVQAIFSDFHRHLIADAKINASKDYLIGNGNSLDVIQIIDLCKAAYYVLGLDFYEMSSFETALKELKTPTFSSIVTSLYNIFKTKDVVSRYFMSRNLENSCKCLLNSSFLENIREKFTALLDNNDDDGDEDIQEGLSDCN